MLSGNRNFEGRVHPEVRANYLASPPLVVAYALAGRIDIEFDKEPLGIGKDGKPVFLKDIWPTQQEVRDVVQFVRQGGSVQAHLRGRLYRAMLTGRNCRCRRAIASPGTAESTYVKHPPYFENMPQQPGAISDIKGARVLALLGDSITTDHISPAGSIKKDSPAGKYLMENGVQPADFNQYGARRGNHEVMVRGTFANVRLKNKLAPGTEGGVTRHLPDGAPMSIFDAAMQYKQEGIPLVVLAGKEYGSGSSRDWAAKGPIPARHQVPSSPRATNASTAPILVGMGMLPLQFKPGETADSLGLTGEEVFDIDRPGRLACKGSKSIAVSAKKADGSVEDVPGAGAHRHAAGGALLPARRHLAVSCCGNCWRGNNGYAQNPSYALGR